MTMDPIVSVLMTSYNREKYIGFAIESVLASTLTNFELIITDDGSKDKTVDIVRSYAQKDPRVKLFINEKNLGDYPNRNQAASHASGKYLKYVDADDYIYPWGLQHLVEMMEAHPEAGWGLCSLEQDIDRPFPFVLAPAEAYKYHYTGPGLFHKAPLSSIIRKDCFHKINGFSNIRMAGDFDMWHKLGKEFNVLLMPQGIVWYREHSEQEMSYYNSFLKVYDQATINHLFDQDCPLTRQEADAILSSTKKRMFKNSIKQLMKLNVKGASSNFNRFRFFSNVR